MVLASDGDEGLAEARASLRERLLTSLAAGYAATAVVQLPDDAGRLFTLVVDARNEGPAGTLCTLPGLPIIPSPLRTQPEPQAIRRQTAQAPITPVSLQEAVRWSFLLDLEYPARRQDRVVVTLTPGGQPATVGATPGRLFERLATYIAVADDLRGLLDGLAPGQPGRAAIGALETWAGLVCEIADAWTTHWQAPTAGPPTALDDGGFVLAFKPALDGTDAFVALTVARTETGAAYDWPSVALSVPEGPSRTLLPTGDSSGPIRTYSLPAGLVAASAPARIELAFAGLAATRHTALAATVRVDRNARLPGPDGAAVRDGFVCRAQTAAAGPVSPLIVSDTAWDIGPWSDDIATCPLGGALSTIFDGAPKGRAFRLEVAYGYAVGAGLVSTSLVALAPTMSDEGVTELLKTMTNWREVQQPPGDGAFWKFAVTVFANDGAATSDPLLSLTNLVSPIAAG